MGLFVPDTLGAAKQFIMEAEFIVVSGGLLGTRFALGPGELRIGRAESAQIRLAEPDVRRRLTDIGCDVPDRSTVSPESLHRLVESEVRRWGSILQPIEEPTK